MPLALFSRSGPLQAGHCILWHFLLALFQLAAEAVRSLTLIFLARPRLGRQSADAVPSGSLRLGFLRTLSFHERTDLEPELWARVLPFVYEIEEDHQES